MATPSRTTLRRRRNRGARLLDSAHPGWRERIDRERLDFRSTRWCILGQVFGWYWDALHALGIDNPKAYGFTLSFTELVEWDELSVDPWDALAAVWRELLCP